MVSTQSIPSPLISTNNHFGPTNGIYESCNQPILSSFDANDFHLNLFRSWEKAAKSGLCRYNLLHQRSKIVPGRYGFVAQVNPVRTGPNFRREPQKFQTVDPPFDQNAFNFNHVMPEEVLERFVNNSDDMMIINSSPLTYGHSLFVPQVTQNISQKITLYGLEMLIGIMHHNPHPYFRAGFSSPGGYASINHQHYHCYYLKEALPIETTTLEHVCGPCFALTQYPSKGFAFQLEDDDINLLARNVFTLISFLQKRGVSHNLFLTRRKHFVTDNSDTLCVFVWARESSFGTEGKNGFNTGLCELAGHLIMKELADYDALKEESNIVKELEDLTEPWFRTIISFIPELYH